MNILDRIAIKKLILFSVVMLWCIGAKAGNIVLTPFNDYLGELPLVQVCSFSYGLGTELAPYTRLTVLPEYTETYGEGSVINAGDGMVCGGCVVPRIVMDENGITTIYCEVNTK